MVTCFPHPAYHRMHCQRITCLILIQTISWRWPQKCKLFLVIARSYKCEPLLVNIRTSSWRSICNGIIGEAVLAAVTGSPLDEAVHTLIYWGRPSHNNRLQHLMRLLQKICSSLLRILCSLKQELLMRLLLIIELRLCTVSLFWKFRDWWRFEWYAAHTSKTGIRKRPFYTVEIWTVTCADEGIAQV